MRGHPWGHAKRLCSTRNAQNAPRRVSRSLLRDCELFPHGLQEKCTARKRPGYRYGRSPAVCQVSQRDPWALRRSRVVAREVRSLCRFSDRRARSALGGQCIGKVTSVIGRHFRNRRSRPSISADDDFAKSSSPEEGARRNACKCAANIWASVCLPGYGITCANGRGGPV